MEGVDRVSRALRPGFNTTLVQLKDTRVLRETTRNDKFQYHTGPIKRYELYKDADLSRLFQYHTGPIKRQKDEFGAVLEELFQYHTGPIKRLRGWLTDWLAG